MPHFFISYAKKDTRELALALNDALNALQGVTAWVDKSLRVGRSWELQIQTEIDRCDYMVVLYSPDINRHKHGEEESYVLTEIAYAKYTLRKAIIPVMAQRTDAPMALTMLQYIDYTLPGAKFADLLEAICEEAGLKPTASAPSASASPTPRTSVVSSPTAAGAYDLLLTDVGPNKINVIKAVRRLTNLGLAEAKTLVESPLPQVVLAQVSREEAEAGRRDLEEMKAKVDIQNGHVAIDEVPLTPKGYHYEIHLAAVGPRIIDVIKEIRAITGLGLMEAKKLVESPMPQPVLVGAMRLAAEDAERRLEAVDAVVTVVQMPIYD